MRDAAGPPDYLPQLLWSTGFLLTCRPTPAMFRATLRLRLRSNHKPRLSVPTYAPPPAPLNLSLGRCVVMLRSSATLYPSPPRARRATHPSFDVLRCWIAPPPHASRNLHLTAVKPWAPRGIAGAFAPLIWQMACAERTVWFPVPCTAHKSHAQHAWVLPKASGSTLGCRNCPYRPPPPTGYLVATRIIPPMLPPYKCWTHPKSCQQLSFMH